MASSSSTAFDFQTIRQLQKTCPDDAVTQPYANDDPSLSRVTDAVIAGRLEEALMLIDQVMTENDDADTSLLGAAHVG